MDRRAVGRRLALGAGAVAALVVGAAVTALMLGRDQPEPIAAEPSLTPMPTIEATPVVEPISTPASPTPAPSIAALPTPSSPLPITPEPAPSPWLPALARHDTARTAVNGLAVRSGPGTNYPLVSGYRWSDDLMDYELQTDAVRLAEGHYLVVDHGPLVVHGVPWYLVVNVSQPSGRYEEMLNWRAQSDLYGGIGWVAGGSTGEAFLVSSDAPPQDDSGHHHHAIPEYAFISGIGAGRTDGFELDLPVGVRWYAADPDGERCSVQFTLQPAGIDMGSMTIDGWGRGDDWWPRDFYPPPAGEHWVEIESECSWSLAVVAIQG